MDDTEEYCPGSTYFCWYQHWTPAAPGFSSMAVCSFFDGAAHLFVGWFQSVDSTGNPWPISAYPSGCLDQECTQVAGQHRGQASHRPLAAWRLLTRRSLLGRRRLHMKADSRPHALARRRRVMAPANGIVPLHSTRYGVPEVVCTAAAGALLVTFPPLRLAPPPCPPPSPSRSNPIPLLHSSIPPNSLPTPPPFRQPANCSLARDVGSLPSLRLQPQRSVLHSLYFWEQQMQQ